MGIRAIRGVLVMEEVVMAPEAQDSVRARAIEWHIRLRDGDGEVWDAFADWLAEDPHHAQVYDEIERTDLAIDPLLADVTFREAANDTDGPLETPARPVRRWGLVGGALAASIAVAVVLAPQLASDRYEVATRAGERHMVALDPATQVILNGSTRMTFDRNDARFASLAEGEALFRVRHDDANPFRLEVGDNIVEDAGTVFNVVHEGGEVRVAVAEGRVVYNPKGNAIALDAGQALVDRAGSDTVRVTHVPVDAVGSWQDGRLVYSNAPLSRVAADLGRALGIRIAVAPTIANRPFSGAIALDGSGPEQLERLKPALNVALETGPDGWTMKPIDGAGH